MEAGTDVTTSGAKDIGNCEPSNRGDVNQTQVIWKNKKHF